jgi:hypothetical protein
MSEENVEIARRGYEAFQRDGLDGLMPFLDEEIEWRNPEDSPIAGVWHGHMRKSADYPACIGELRSAEGSELGLVRTTGCFCFRVKGGASASSGFAPELRPQQARRGVVNVG